MLIWLGLIFKTTSTNINDHLICIIIDPNHMKKNIINFSAPPMKTFENKIFSQDHSVLLLMHNLAVFISGRSKNFH